METVSTCINSNLGTISLGIFLWSKWEIDDVCFCHYWEERKKGQKKLIKVTVSKIILRLHLSFSYKFWVKGFLKGITT